MRSLLLLVATASTLFATGCTIQQRSPIREVAYDFSDYAYYDRPYAQSPEYQRNHSDGPMNAPAQGAVEGGSIGQAAPGSRGTGQAGSIQGAVRPHGLEAGGPVAAGNLCGIPAR